MIWNLRLTVPLFLVLILFPLLNFKSPTFFTKTSAFGGFAGMLNSCDLLVITSADASRISVMKVTKVMMMVMMMMMISEQGLSRSCSSSVSSSGRPSSGECTSTLRTPSSCLPYLVSWLWWWWWRRWWRRWWGWQWCLWWWWCSSVQVEFSHTQWDALPGLLHPQLRSVNPQESEEARKQRNRVIRDFWNIAFYFDKLWCIIYIIYIIYII